MSVNRERERERERERNERVMKRIERDVERRG